MDPTSIVQTTNSWLLSDWYVPGIALDAVRKISILGTEVYALRGHLDRRHQAKDISKSETVKYGRCLKVFCLNMPIT